MTTVYHHKGNENSCQHIVGQYGNELHDDVVDIFYCNKEAITSVKEKLYCREHMEERVTEPTNKQIAELIDAYFESELPEGEYQRMKPEMMAYMQKRLAEVCLSACGAQGLEDKGLEDKGADLKSDEVEHDNAAQVG